MVDVIETVTDLGAEIEEHARSLGAEVYGVASAEKYGELFPKKPQPSKFVEDARSVIIVGLPFSREIMDTVAKPWLAEIHRKAADDAASDQRGLERPTAGAERYYLGPENSMLTHEVSMIGYRLAQRLHRMGHRAFYFPEVLTEPRFKTAPFYFMPAMYVAGMGQLGMNCAIITPRWGPRIRVTAVITDLELPAGEPMEGMFYPDCETCIECVKRCPSKAINGRYWKNVFACSSYGCSATCLSVCPAGEEI
jgi:epoxyqueuosine reductase QueG